MENLLAELPLNEEFSLFTAFTSLLSIFTSCPRVHFCLSMAQSILDDGSISVCETMRYINEGHNDIVKVTRVLHPGNYFPEIKIGLGDKRTFDFREVP